MEPTLIRVAGVEALSGLTVRLRFTDGTSRVVDLEPLMKGPVFEPLRRDPSQFRRVRVDADLGTIVWPNGADLCPDLLRHGGDPEEE